MSSVGECYTFLGFDSLTLIRSLYRKVYISLYRESYIGLYSAQYITIREKGIMFIPDKEDVVMPKKGSVTLYLDTLTDKLFTRKRVQVHLSDISRPISNGGLGWNIPSDSRPVRPGDTSLDFDSTGLVALVDSQGLADRLEKESLSRGYGIVFYVIGNTIYGARNYPE
jgi:hypothetical protein